MEIDGGGDIGLVTGGGGASLVVFDAVRRAGGSPAAYTEVGGNPTAAKVQGLTRAVLDCPGVRGLLVAHNLTSNTQVDLVAEGVLAALAERGLDAATFPVVAREVGTHDRAGRAALEAAGVETLGEDVGLEAAAARIVERVAGSARVIERGARVVVQGATGREARMVVRHMLAYGTAIAAGVTPGRGGEDVDGVPIYDSVEDAVAAGGPIAASLVSVPPAATLDAACEALAAGVGLLVVATENVPRLDAARLRRTGPGARGHRRRAQLRRPDPPGRADEARRDRRRRRRPRVRPGAVAVMSRSGGLTVETALGLRLAGLGVSTAVSVGGDAIVGTPPAPLAERLAADPGDACRRGLGEPGTRHELDLADAIAAGRIGVPVVAHVPGRFMEDFPQGMRFGHAGAVIGGDDERPGPKLRALAEAGALVAETYGEIVPLVRDALARHRVPPPSADAAPMAAGAPPAALAHQEDDEMALPTYGPMAVDWETRIDFDALRGDRVARAKRQLEQAGIGAFLCFDTANIRYITATVIGTWANDKAGRFCLLPSGGEPHIWDFGSAARHHALYCPWLEGRSEAGISTQHGAMPAAAEPRRGRRHARSTTCCASTTSSTPRSASTSATRRCSSRSRSSAWRSSTARSS